MRIRGLRVSDLFRQILPGRLSGSNLINLWQADPALQDSPPLFDLVRQGVAPRGTSSAFIMLDGFRVGAIAVMRQLQGFRSWQLTDLYSTPRALLQCNDLLEYCSNYASKKGAERLFLRVSQESQLRLVARRSGFLDGFTEDMYQMGKSATPSSLSNRRYLRSLTRSDHYKLFKLYNQTVPASVRFAVGLTLEQWSDSREKVKGNPVEMVFDRDHDIRFWARIRDGKEQSVIEASLNPNEHVLSAVLCEEVIKLAQRRDETGTVLWLVPGYQPGIAGILRGLGWEKKESSLVLVKALAETVKHSGMIPIRI